MHQEPFSWYSRSFTRSFVNGRMSGLLYWLFFKDVEEADAILLFHSLPCRLINASASFPITSSSVRIASPFFSSAHLLNRWPSLSPTLGLRHIGLRVSVSLYLPGSLSVAATTLSKLEPVSKLPRVVSSLPALSLLTSLSSRDS